MRRSMSVAKSVTKTLAMRCIPSGIRARLLFRYRAGYWPNLRSPKTFNEKVLHRVLCDRNPLFPRLADKLAVREHVASRVGAQYLTELFAVFDDASSLDMSSLPKRVVLKATHDSGSVVVIDETSSLSEHELKRHFDKVLRCRYGEWSHEWWYSEIPPRIIAEENLSLPGMPPPNDYKFFVFHGSVRMVQVDVDRFSNHRRNLYLPDWSPIDGQLLYPPGAGVPRPKNLAEMIAVAEALARDLDFVRVDLYSLDDCTRVIFGEMTFAPGAGMEPFSPRSLDDWLGQMW